MEDQPSILKLNEYCLMEIFSYFNIQEVLQLEEICAEFKIIAESFYRKQLEFKYASRACDDDTVKKIALRVGPHLETLQIDVSSSEADFFEETNSESEDVKCLLSHCRNLQNLEFQSCSIMNLMKIIPLEETFAPLKTLMLENCDLTDEIAPCLKAATHLKSLSLAGSCEIQGSFLKDMKYLEEIDLSNCDELSKANFLDFCEDNLTLKSLKVSMEYYARDNFDQECFQAIVNGLKNLESIKISIFSGISSKEIDISILGDLPKLIRVELESTDWLNFSSFLQSVSTRLESFKIEDALMKDDIITITKFEKLKELKLFEINDEELKILTQQLLCKNILEVFEIPVSFGNMPSLEKCLQLKRLDLSNCYEITNDLIIKLVPVLNERPQNISINLFRTRCEDSIHEELKCMRNSKMKLIT